MIVKLLTSIFFIVLIPFVSIASDIYSSDLQSDKQAKQRELNTISDYNSMISDLKQGVALGNLDSMFFLGVTYLNGTTLKDGTVIKKDGITAHKLLFKAIEKGSVKSLAVLALASINSMNVSTLSTAVKIAQNSQLIDIKDKDYYSLMLASLILDTDSNDANAIEIATKWIYKAEKKRPTPKMQFILASIYLKLGNERAANYYINKSCKDKSMAKMCQQFKVKRVK